jgi:hypothetical protein
LSGLIDDVEQSLKSGCPERQAEMMLRAMFYFEKALGRPEGSWTKDVIEETVSSEKVTRLRNVLVAFVTANLPPPPVASALSALSVLGDPTLADLFRSCLKCHLHGDASILHQAIVALENIGEKLIPRKGGKGYLSAIDFDRNRDLAVDYLTRIENL